MRRIPLTLLCAALLLGGTARAAPPSSRALDAVPLHVLPTQALEKVRASLPPPATRGPLRMAINVPMPLDLDDGLWSQDGQTAVWRARVYSAGATLLIAGFDRVELPPGAELRFSDAAGTTVQGPYTAADRNAAGGLWTALVPGEEALLELRVPASLRDASDLHMATLSHGEYELRNEGARPKSGNCNIDTACPQGDGWREQIRSVVRLQVPSGTPGLVTLCTGQLINNTAQNDRPYVLTANHCGITGSSAANVVAYFNFETSTCAGTPDGSMTQTRSGATRVFANERSDHTLLRLSSAPSASFGAYFSGFDASASAIPLSGVSIHHPDGDEKRISTFDSAASRANDICLGNSVAGTCNGAIIDTFRVNWASGVTEQGSSGGGLWNQNERLVGVLSGGNSNCSNPGGDDFYGRLELAWSNGLGAILDPAGGGATRSLGGKELGGSPASGDAVGGSGGRAGNGESDDDGGGSFGAAFALLFAALGRMAIRRRPRA